ncbi:DsbA family protein [Fulvivirga imtechensis]|nr:DsbA family protein [Fulvivirga imtechensis]
MNNKKGRVEIEYFTDPLCCWSWAFEPQWRRLRYEYKDQVRWKYRMTGLLSDWKAYNDPMNSVTRPTQMGPVWKEAQHISGMPVNDKVWVENPPRSSYPACLAVKTAELQGAKAGEHYLRRVREAVMTELRDVARGDVLQQIAHEVAEEWPGLLDDEQFEHDFSSRAALSDFKKDLKRVKQIGINRYPTLTLKVKGRKGVMITGYRPYSVLLQALQSVCPGIQRSRKIENIDDYWKYWGTLTDRELSEAELTFGSNEAENMAEKYGVK